MAEKKQVTVTPDPDCRENPNRCIRIFGEFTDELAERVLVDFAALRAQGNEPVTVYINSYGGSFRVLEIINGALNGRNQDGRGVRIITVCYATAASAAANMLAFGDYAIAFPKASIYFHGVRRLEDEITAEKAARLSREYLELNRSTANELAAKVFGRLVHRYMLLKEEAERILRRAKKKKETKNPLACFAECLCGKVGNRTSALVMRSVKVILDRQDLMVRVIPRALKNRHLNALKQDASVLRHLLEYEVEQHRDRPWRLDEDGVAQLTADYFLIREHFFGEHVAIVERYARTFASAFLPETAFKRYQKMLAEKKESKAAEILSKHAEPIAEPFFYFAHALCRNLVQSENPLSSSEAYWLGIVDEVAGTPLAGYRQVSERQETEQKAATTPAAGQPTASSPQPGQSPPAAPPLNAEPAPAHP